MTNKYTLKPPSDKQLFKAWRTQVRDVMSKMAHDILNAASKKMYRSKLAGVTPDSEGLVDSRIRSVLHAKRQQFGIAKQKLLSRGRGRFRSR